MAKAKIEIHQPGLSAHNAATTGIHGTGLGIDPNFKAIWDSGDILSTTNPDTARNQWVENGFLYAVCCYGLRLAIYDIHDITSPIQLSLTNITWGTYGGVDIRKKGNFLFVSGYIGIQVIDVSRPQYPSVVTQFNINNTFVHGMFLRANILYCCQHITDKFVLVDVSNPPSPVKMGELSGATYFNGCHDVFVDEKYAYVTNYLAGAGEYGLTVVNISNPYNPAVVTGVAENCKQSNITKKGRYIFCGSHSPDTGMRIFDAKDPSSPILLGNFLTGEGATFGYGMGWYGDYLVTIGARSKKAYIIDVINPSNPVIADSLAIATSDVKNLFVWGKYAFVSYTNLVTSTYYWRLCILEIKQGFEGSPREHQLWLQNKRTSELEIEKLSLHTGLTTKVHGAVSTATASRIVIRDASGRAAFAAPSASADAAILSTITGHAALTTGVHGVGAEIINDLYNIIMNRQFLVLWYANISTAVTLSGSVTQWGYRCDLATGATINSTALTYCMYRGRDVINTHEPMYEVDFAPSSVADVQVQFGIIAGADPTAVAGGFGIDIVDNAIRAFSSDGTTRSVLDLSTAFTATYFTVRQVLVGGVIKTWINNVAKEDKTTNIPTTQIIRTWSMRITNTAAANKVIYMMTPKIVWKP